MPVKPCQTSPGRSIQHPGSCARIAGSASANGTLLPSGMVTSSGCQARNHQSPGLQMFICPQARAIICRNRTASSIASCMSPQPPISIILEETSREAMMLYCGEVDACIMKDSLKSAWSSGRFPFLMWIIDACESAASSLWVEWVVMTVGRFSAGRSSLCMPNFPAYMGLNLAYPYQASSKWIVSTVWPRRSSAATAL